MAERALDVIAIGRVSIDLYGQQIGGRLEDMASFAKYVGGCPANIAIGCARLGLRSALLSRVGDEHMGRFVREQLEREGVDTQGLAVDPARLTALVILGIRDRNTFPLIFFRENCADMAMSEADIDEGFIASAKAVVVTGTHFSTPLVAAASRRAMALARRHGGKVVLDIDYRPVLWGLAGHGQGERRFVDDAQVTALLQSILPQCDLIVGTEEEIHAGGGSTDTLAALRAIRELSQALIVMKRGPLGCVAYPEAIPGRVEGGVTGEGFPVEVYNVLGAGDGFMSGFLCGHLSGLPLAETCRTANACGALVVSRHGCAPATPTWSELAHFLDRGSTHPALRLDPALNHIHWATTRREKRSEVLAVALDHRTQFEYLAERHGQPIQRIAAFKRLVFRAATLTAGAQTGFGLIVDDRYGGDVLDLATGSGCWLARPIERPDCTPLEFEGGADVGLTLREWPVNHTVKCLVFYRADDAPDLRACQERRLLALWQACRLTDHELLLEVIADRERPGDVAPLVAALRRLYEIGIKPDWWKLPAPESSGGWAEIEKIIRGRDPYCRGVLLLGLGAGEAELARQIEDGAGQPICRGFAIGRSIFAAAAEAWFAGHLDDAAAVTLMADTYRRLLRCWQQARGRAAEPLETIAR
jgi:5-dehydro-2-deoxygluconokinase